MDWNQQHQHQHQHQHQQLQLQLQHQQQAGGTNSPNSQQQLGWPTTTSIHQHQGHRQQRGQEQRGTGAGSWGNDGGRPVFKKSEQALLDDAVDCLGGMSLDDNAPATDNSSNNNSSNALVDHHAFGGGGRDRGVDGLNIGALQVSGEPRNGDGGSFCPMNQGNPFSISVGGTQRQQQQAPPPSLLAAHGGVSLEQLGQQGFGLHGKAAAAAAAATGAGAAGVAGGGGIGVGCGFSSGGAAERQGVVEGRGAGGRRGPDGSWLDEEGRRLYTESEVREAIEQERRAWRDKAASLEASLSTMESEAKAALMRADRALAEMTEQLKAAEGKTYALSVHLAQSNRPPHLA